jgi:hypothetical protein
MLGQIADDLWELRGSTSRRDSYEILMQQVVEKQLLKKRKGFKLKRVGKKPAKIKAKTQTTKASPISKKRAKTRTRHRVSTKGPTTKAGNPDMRFKQNKEAWGGRGAGSPIALIQLLNSVLPQELLKNMTGVYPKSLEWRTGRFGQSAQVTSIVPMPNMTQIQYTYQKNPYEVFEGQGGRDPRDIIGGTIREIAQSIMGNKFGLVRTKRV